MPQIFPSVPTATLSFGVYGDSAPRFPTSLETAPKYVVERQAEQHRLETELNELISTWLDETIDISSLHQMVSHPSYLKLIGNGRRALPILFRELAREPNHWFTALRAITGENPVPDGARGNVKKMRDYWISWAEAEEYA